MAQKILKYDMITIKSRLNGFTRTVGRPEFNGMIDKADYDIIATKGSVSNNPDTSWTVSNIKKWLDDNGITYTGSHDTKAKLLALINA